MLLLKLHVTHNSSIRSDEGLTLETSAFRISVRWPIYIINSVDKTKFLYTTSPQVAWTENYLITDASEKLDYFNEVFLDILDKHAPIKIIKLKHRQCAFLDEDTRDLMIERNQLLKIARETKSPRDWELYRASRKHVKTRLREAEMNFVQNELQQCKKNSSKRRLGTASLGRSRRLTLLPY